MRGGWRGRLEEEVIEAQQEEDRLFYNLGTKSCNQGGR